MEPNGNNTFPSSTAPMPTLFGAFDKCIAIATRQMVAHVISSFREIDTKTIDPVSLKKLIREDLESFVGQLLGIFDNVGSVLPEDTLGFKITTDSMLEKAIMNVLVKLSDFKKPVNCSRKAEVPLFIRLMMKM